MTGGQTGASGRTPVGALLAAAVLLVGCGRLAGGGQAPAPEPTPSAIATPLPELPPNHVLYPELFDEEGCAKLGGGEVDCGAPPLPGFAPVDDPADPEAWRDLLGFHGPSYLGEFPPGGLVLVPGSVWTSSAGPWRAFGLVRNQTSAPAGAEVTATLLAPDGRELGRASAHVPVDPLRPGEPGPFALSSELPAEEVAEVRWEVTATPPGGLVVRDLMIRAPIWEVPYGDREARERYDAPPASPPYPYAALGYVSNLSGLVPGTPSATVRQPLVVAAWVDPEGRIAWVASAAVGEFPGDASFSEALSDDVQPGAYVGGAFYLIVTDPEVGPLLTDPKADLRPMFWAASPGYVEGEA